MKEYLKMSDVFDAACNVPVAMDDELYCGDNFIAEFCSRRIAINAAHAINSHDELVEMNKELLELVSEMLNSGTFFISAVESDSFDVDFSDWEKRASALVSSIQEKSE
ncbi:MAG: hypothetical protein ACRCXB_01085 [Aeromonadaceae bacterium]